MIDDKGKAFALLAIGCMWFVAFFGAIIWSNNAAGLVFCAITWAMDRDEKKGSVP